MRPCHGAFLGALLVAAIGCGGTNNANGNDGGTGMVTCDPFPNVGMTVGKTTHAGAVPTMTGGTVADGTYGLTAYDLYNGETGSSTNQETWVFSNGTVKFIGSQNGAAPMILGGTFTTSGTTMTWHFTCPQTGTLSVSYTATPTTFVFIAPKDTNQVQSYAKQ